MKDKHSIRNRTDESLVRTIAAWMKLDPSNNWHNYLGVFDGDWFNPLQHPEDRERMMLHVPPGIAYSSRSKKLYDFRNSIERGGSSEFWDVYESFAVDRGRAFCECVVAWIEAQGETP